MTKRVKGGLAVASPRRLSDIPSLEVTADSLSECRLDRGLFLYRLAAALVSDGTGQAARRPS